MTAIFAVTNVEGCGRYKGTENTGMFIYCSFNDAVRYLNYIMSNNRLIGGGRGNVVG
jgi:hypothetical protein